jgi:hypothetical protein
VLFSPVFIQTEPRSVKLQPTSPIRAELPVPPRSSRDENPVTATPLFSTLTNRDARNSFRFRSYENCRVTSPRPVIFLSLTLPVSPLHATLMDHLESAANKRLTAKAKLFRCNTYKKTGVPLQAKSLSLRSTLPTFRRSDLQTFRHLAVLSSALLPALQPRKRAGNDRAHP